MTQRLNLAAFLARSSEAPFDETPLGSAIKRLPAVSAEGPWLCGGALRRTLAEQKLDSDFDFFFRSERQFEAFRDAMTFDRDGKEIGSHDHAVTFSLPKADKAPELRVQAIRTRWFDTIEQALDSFDFTICQFGYDGRDLVCGDYSLWDLANRRLVPHKITFATATLRRLLKYTRQGFTVCGGGLANILQQVVDDPAIIRATTQYID